MKKIVSGILIAMALTIGVGSSFAQNEQVPPTPTNAVVATGVITTEAGITPASPFYFLDRLGEFLRELFAFSPEAKVKLKIEFAKERIAEIKIMLENGKSKAGDVEQAQSLLVEDIQDAKNILSGENMDDQDVKDFGTILDDEIDNEDSDSKQTFEDVKSKLNEDSNDQEETDKEDNQK